MKVLEARFDLKNNIGIFPGAGDFEGKMLRESRAGHLIVPLLPESFWEFHDSFVPSETAGLLVFLDECGEGVVRETIRVLSKTPPHLSTFTSEKGHCE